MNTYLKVKTFTLLSGIIKGNHRWRVHCRIQENNSFHNKGYFVLIPNEIENAAFNRGLGFHKISLWHEGCVWHHVNKRDVVATPKRIHAISAGFSQKGDKFNHRSLEGILG